MAFKAISIIYNTMIAAAYDQALKGGQVIDTLGESIANDNKAARYIIYDKLSGEIPDDLEGKVPYKTFKDETDLTHETAGIDKDIISIDFYDTGVLINHYNGDEAGTIIKSLYAKKVATSELYPLIKELQKSSSGDYKKLDGKISDLANTVNNHYDSVDTKSNVKLDERVNTNKTNITNLTNTVNNHYSSKSDTKSNVKLDESIGSLYGVVKGNYSDLDKRITDLTTTVNNHYNSEDTKSNTSLNTTINSNWNGNKLDAEGRNASNIGLSGRLSDHGRKSQGYFDTIIKVVNHNAKVSNDLLKTDKFQSIIIGGLEKG